MMKRFLTPAWGLRFSKLRAEADKIARLPAERMSDEAFHAILAAANDQAGARITIEPDDDGTGNLTAEQEAEMLASMQEIATHVRRERLIMRAKHMMTRYDKGELQSFEGMTEEQIYERLKILLSDDPEPSGEA